MPIRLYLATIVIVILIVFNVFFILKNANHEANLPSGGITEASILHTTDAKAFIQPISEASYLPILNTNFPVPDIKAKAAIVYDVNSTKHLYRKNIDQKLPIASVTKLLTAVTVLDKLNLREIVYIPAEVLKVDGQKQDLFLGERLTVEDLLKMILIKSSNDAAYALVHHAKSQNIDLVGEMNKKAQELRMTDSYFKDPAGLNDEAYATINDLIKLVDYALSYPKLWNILSQKTVLITSVDGINHDIRSTNQLLGEFSGVIGGKTGYTESALGCMVLVVQIPNNDDKIISIILGSTERFTDTRKLIEWSTQAYRWN